MRRNLQLLLSVSLYFHQALSLCEPEAIYTDRAATAFIPFSNWPNCTFPDCDAILKFSVQTVLSTSALSVETPMDTGSTGLAMSGHDLGFDDLTDFSAYPNGTEYLSSSRRFWSGYWVPSIVTFPTQSGEVVAQIPVLVVVQNGTCLQLANDGSCIKLTNAVSWPTGIRYMGVGFGRWSNQQPQALPDRVTLTNIVSINGEEVDMHAGYIVNRTGVQLGLTASNTQGFNETALDFRTNSTSPSDWNMVNMSLAIDDLAWNCGQALFDTGVSQSYILVDQATYDQSQKEVFSGHQILRPGTNVNIFVGNISSPIASYSVIANDTNPLNPALGQFVMEKPDPTRLPFINTGRHFYNSFDTLFDAECGRFGLRQNTIVVKIPRSNILQHSLDL